MASDFCTACPPELPSLPASDTYPRPAMVKRPGRLENLNIRVERVPEPEVQVLAIITAAIPPTNPPQPISEKETDAETLPEFQQPTAPGRVEVDRGRLRKDTAGALVAT